MSRANTKFNFPLDKKLKELEAAGGGGGVTDHGALTGLTDDDHLQYHNDTRGDARYYLKATVDSALAGKQPLATVLTNTTASFTTADETKLDGIATGATANSSDATLLARANHTGTQTASTISDFNSATRAQTEAELIAGTNITITPASSGATRTLTIAASGGGGNLDSLSDVVITAPSNTQVLKYNGTNWVNDTDATGGGGGGSPILSWMI